MDHQYLQSYEMSWGTLGTVRPFSNFHPERDVMEIQMALEKNDSLTIVRILTNRNNPQRQAIAKTFEEITQKDLVTALKKALSGDLEYLMSDLMMPPAQYEAHRLQRAMAGIGTDEETLLEILCTRSGERLREIREMYNNSYRKDLEQELKAETSREFLKLVVALLNKENVTGYVQRDIESLSTSVNANKVNAKPWINILTSRDSRHLKKVLMGLELEHGQTMVQILEKKFTGDIEIGLKVLGKYNLCCSRDQYVFHSSLLLYGIFVMTVQCIQDPYTYLAKRLASMKTSVLQGIMVSHCEEDLLCIRAAYLKYTGISLYTALQRHFSGHHLQALLTICRSED
ncbi:annexin A2 isoform X1 [Antennarius striatus]|uniref:annexin A2 isoform X1 n=1 Tax=Antennarius striatus TaxID=241820 RepID=UPI0035B1236A